MMKRNVSFGLTVILIFSVFAVGCTAQQPPVETSPLEDYYNAIDTAYGLSVIEALSAFGTNPELGFRTAGSEAELAAADFLENEMREIGLQNVRKEPITVDTWTFQKAELAYTGADGAEQRMIMAAFATQYVAEGEELSLIYAGKGTAADYEGLDATGKLVLIDIDQDQDWWINWPAYQAKVKGAKAVIAINVGGYDQYSDETLGVQDICGPADAPAFTVTQKDGTTLKALIETADAKSIPVKLTADSQVQKDGTAYTIIGEIPGKTNEVIYACAHYDGYFYAFEDDASGTGAMYAIAKALVDSGYEPEKTIRFISHPAEEWGISDSRYDWATGAYVTINNHPEWVENAFALINLDGGITSNQAEGIEIRSSWELSTFAQDVGELVEGNPFDAFAVSCPPSSWTEDFSYSQMGIPVFCSGYSGDELASEEVYHSNMDTKEYFYDEDAFAFTQKLYGTYIIELDQRLALPLDYVAYFEGLKEKIEAEGTDNTAELVAAVDEAIESAGYLNAAIDENEWTQEAAASFNQELKKIYLYGQDKLVSLNWWEELIFAHERYQANVNALAAAIESLEGKDGRTALDEYLYAVDMNWYAYDFDREVYDYFENQVLGPDARNAWGTGYLKDNADLFDVIRAVQDKAAADSTDYTAEIGLLKQELTNQQALLFEVTAQMIRDVNAMTRMIDKIAE